MNITHKTQKFLCIGYVAKHPDSSAWQVSQGTMLPFNSIGTLLKRLVDQGLLTREPSKGPRGGWGYRVVLNRKEK